MNPRVEVVLDVAGIKVGDTVTEEQLETLIKVVINDMMHYVHHVDSGKYPTIHDAVNRINYLIRESYGML
jgi:hypothetical protein